MRLFDGQQWHVVELPEELLTLRDNKYAGIVGIASDCVLLSADGMLYRIILGGKTYKAELCGTLP